MRQEGVVVLTTDAKVIGDLVRLGCAAVSAFPSDGAVGEMRRRRRLEIGTRFLEELGALDEPDAQGILFGEAS